MVVYGYVLCRGTEGCGCVMVVRRSELDDCGYQQQRPATPCRVSPYFSHAVSGYVIGSTTYGKCVGGVRGIVESRREVPRFDGGTQCSASVYMRKSTLYPSQSVRSMARGRLWCRVCTGAVHGGGGVGE